MLRINRWIKSLGFVSLFLLVFFSSTQGALAASFKAHWVNRSTIQVDEAKYDAGADAGDFGYQVSDEANAVSAAKGNGYLQNLINNDAKGSYTDTALLDGLFQYTKSNCGNGVDFLNFPKKTDGIANNSADFNIANGSGDAPSAYGVLSFTNDVVGLTSAPMGCHALAKSSAIMKASWDPVNVDNPNDAHDIWFEAVNSTTLHSVDPEAAKAGDLQTLPGEDAHTYYFTQAGPDSNYIGKCDDQHYARVKIPADAKPDANNHIHGSYDVCRTDGDYQGNFDVIIDHANNIVDKHGEPATTPNPGTGTTVDSTPRCESGGLSWVICPIINGLAGASDLMFEKVVQPALQTDTISVAPSTPTTPNYIFQAWSSMRIYGNILLVIGMLVIVFGQAIGGGLIDAYTAKKVLPRILAAAIMLNLSIYIVAVLVDITNILGHGINSLLTGLVASGTPGALNLQLNAGASTIGIAAIVGTGASIWALSSAGVGLGTVLQPILLFVLLPLALALIAVVVTIILRKGLIMLLIITAPIAFALYCLPNTEQYFRKWWKLLFEALLVYPIIGAIFGIANLMAVTINHANTSNGVTSAIAQLISIIVLIIPLFLIPYSFKLAGGVLGNLHGQLTGFGKKANESILGNPNDENSMRRRAKRGMSEAATRAQGKMVYGGRPQGGNSPDDMSFRARRQRALSRTAGMFGNVDSRMSDLTAQAAKRREQLSGTGDDWLLYAANGYEKDGKFYNGKGAQISKGDYKKGQSLYGASPYQKGQTLSYQVGKIQTDEDVANFRKAFTENAIANNWTDAEAGGVWAAATYPHKAILGSEWYSSPSVQQDAKGHTSGVSFQDIGSTTENYGKFIGEKHKTLASFQVGSMRDQEWRAMAEVHQATEAKIAAGTASQEELDNYAMTDEVLNTMTGQGMVQYNPEGKAVVSGATAASKGVIEAMFDNRQYSTTQEVGAGGEKSVDRRVIYNHRAVEAAKDAHAAVAASAARAGLRAPGAFDEGAAIAHNTIGGAKVTGDINRSGVPR